MLPSFGSKAMQCKYCFSNKTKRKTLLTQFAPGTDVAPPSSNVSDLATPYLSKVKISHKLKKVSKIML